MGVTKAHSALQGKCGLYDSPGGESIAPGAAVRTFDEGFDSFLFGLVLLAFGGCSPQVGSRQRRAEEIFPLELRTKTVYTMHRPDKRFAATWKFTP